VGVRAVSRGLQRIGRAGHSVGEPSKGTIFPKHRGDLLEAAIVVRRMRDGLIEETRYLRNPLDVLAQQIVAMTAMEEWSVPDLAAVVRRRIAAPVRDPRMHRLMDRRREQERHEPNQTDPDLLHLHAEVSVRNRPSARTPAD